MKAVAKCLTVLALLVLLALAYMGYASRLIVTYSGVNVASCADHPQTFETVRDYALRGTADVTVFTGAPGMSAEDYKFITFSVNVRNLNVLDAEWMDLTVTPRTGDLMQVNSRVTDLAGFNSDTMTVILVCDRGVTDLTREATLSYYVYGRYHEIALTLNGQA